MSFLTTTAHLHHRTLLPPTATRPQALSLFRSHDKLIRLDPDLSSYEEVPAPATAKDDTKYYKVTDVMHALPAGLWDSTVAFAAEITDIENGVEWVVRAPLGLVQRTLFTIEEASDDDLCGEQDPEKKSGRLALVEDVEIRCSRLLVGTVKGKIEGNWKGIHKRWIEHLATMEQ